MAAMPQVEVVEVLSKACDGIHCPVSDVAALGEN